MSACPTLTNLLSIISEFAVVDSESIGFMDTLASLGLDSIDTLELRIEIEDQFEIDLPEALLVLPTTTIATLHDAIQAASSLKTEN
jgi:acyl carrier protein